MTMPSAAPSSSPTAERLANAVAEQVALLQLNQQLLAAFAPSTALECTDGMFRSARPEPAHA